jgi:hypothetical protein
MLGKTLVRLLSMSGVTTFPSVRSLAALAATILGATGMALALATPPAQAAKPCWERVLDDWVDNGRIDGVYSASCLEAARRHVPEDIRAYSDFEDRIDEAMQDRAIQSAGGGGNPPPPGKTTTGGNGSSKSQPEPQPKADTGSGPRDEGPISAVLSTGTNDANSIPLPLIILAGLALLLMAAGATGLVARKVQARRSRSS